MGGASTWNHDSLGRIARSMRILMSRRITPTTTEMMEEANRVGSAEINYTQLKKDVTERLARPLRCPAQHAVLPLELRLDMSSRATMLKVFPNMDGAPTEYLPIRMFLCGVCQEVFRERELEPVEVVNVSA